MSNEFWTIEQQIKDAAECLSGAVYDIDRLEVADGERDGWPEMSELRAKLEAVGKQLLSADFIPPTVRKAIQDEAEYNDEMADRADAMSY